MGTKVVVDHLAQVDLFRELTRPQLSKIAKVTDRVEVRAGTVLIRERTYRSGSGPAFYLIESGTVEVTKAKKKVATLKDGASFGEMSLLDGKPRFATVTAKTDLVLYRIMAWHFLRVVEREPKVAMGLLRSVAGRMRAVADGTGSRY